MAPRQGHLFSVTSKQGQTKTTSSPACSVRIYTVANKPICRNECVPLASSHVPQSGARRQLRRSGLEEPTTRHAHPFHAAHAASLACSSHAAAGRTSLRTGLTPVLSRPPPRASPSLAAPAKIQNRAAPAHRAPAGYQKYLENDWWIP